MAMYCVYRKSIALKFEETGKLEAEERELGPCFSYFPKREYLTSGNREMTEHPHIKVKATMFKTIISVDEVSLWSEKNIGLVHPSQHSLYQLEKVLVFNTSASNL